MIPYYTWFCSAEVHKQDWCICWGELKCCPRIIHRPVCPVGKLQGVQQGFCDVRQVIQHQFLKWFHDNRCLGDGPIDIQLSDSGFLGNQDDGGAFEAGENLKKLQRIVQDLHEIGGPAGLESSQAGRGHTVKSWNLPDLSASDKAGIHPPHRSSEWREEQGAGFTLKESRWLRICSSASQSSSS